MNECMQELEEKLQSTYKVGSFTKMNNRDSSR